MTNKDYIDYFENLAFQSTEIDHLGNNEGERGFFTIEYENFLSNLSSGIKYIEGEANTVMVLLTFPWGYGNNESHLQKDYDAAFVVLQHVKEVNNFEQIANAIGTAETIIHQTNLRIIHDANDSHALFTNEIDLSTFRVNPVLRQSGNYYGAICQFEFMSFIGSCIDGSKWNDLDDEQINAYQ